MDNNRMAPYLQPVFAAVRWISRHGLRDAERAEADQKKLAARR
jgi:hypothetical protein